MTTPAGTARYHSPVKPGRAILQLLKVEIALDAKRED
jgi:hypothetical protein